MDINIAGSIAEVMMDQQTIFLYPQHGKHKEKYSRI